MFDFLSLFFDFIAICFIGFIVIIGVKFFYSLVNAGKSSSSYNEKSDKQLREHSREDSEADLAMTTDDEDSWMFPPESEEDDGL